MNIFDGVGEHKGSFALNSDDENCLLTGADKVQSVENKFFNGSGAINVKANGAVEKNLFNANLIEPNNASKIQS